MAIDTGIGELTIGALAELTGASPRSLRHYEAQGVLTSSRGTGGARRYGPEAIERVVLIRTLLGAGLCMKGVRDALPDVHVEQGEVVPGADLATRLRWERDRLTRAIGHLETSRAVLDDLLERAGSEPVDDVGDSAPADAQTIRATVRQAQSGL